MNLPTKWAVEITCLQDAERLQELYPDDMSASCRSLMSMVKTTIVCYGDKACLSPCGIYGYYVSDAWMQDNSEFYKQNGYTILSLTELEKLY